jgi:hypothetical protein
MDTRVRYSAVYIYTDFLVPEGLHRGPDFFIPYIIDYLRVSYNFTIGYTIITS